MRIKYTLSKCPTCHAEIEQDSISFDFIPISDYEKCYQEMAFNCFCHKKLEILNREMI